MIDLKDFIANMIRVTGNPKGASTVDVISFFEHNQWFNDVPDFQGKVMLTDRQVRLYSPALEKYLLNDASSEKLLEMLAEKYPATTEQLIAFYNEKNLEEKARFFLSDFLLWSLKKDLVLYTDAELKPFLVQAVTTLTKTNGDILTFFLAWLRKKYKTRYFKDYQMEKRYTMDVQNDAYSLDEYLMLLYYMLNPNYIEDNEMYRKAANSKNYVDTWLYLSMHFICSLRQPDLERIYHPDLMYPPEQVVQQIRDGTFTDSDARLILLSITQRMSVLPLTPNKTSSNRNVPYVKFYVPHSCEVHFGKLFALAEAHRRIEGKPNEPIIRKISTYAEISRYMGEEIGFLFLNSDFRSRSATKSYLQSIYMMSDEITKKNPEDNTPNMMGYLLAAFARSHKGNYAEFASTTFEYLKDAKFSGLTPEIIAYELLERGVLSFIPVMLLNTLYGQDFDKLSVGNQTSLIKTLNLSPYEIESVVSIVNESKRKSELAVKESLHSDVDILTALHRIGTGQAFSKEPECLCLCSAINRMCPYTTRRQCIGCKFEISTKSTFYLLLSEWKRMSQLHDNSTSQAEKKKYKYLINSIIIPKMDEMLTCLKKNYGEEVFIQYEQLIEEVVS